MAPMRATLAMSFISIGLVACTTAPQTEQTTAVIERAKPVVPVSVSTEAPDPGALGSYSIPPGRCGMVLWTRAGTEVVPIFQTLEDGTGLMEIDGEMTALARIGADGEARANIPQFQSFKANGGETGDVTINARTVWGTPFQGGSYVSRGTLTLTGADGWSRVVPVAGIAGCKA